MTFDYRWKCVTGVLEIRTQGCRMVGEDETAEIGMVAHDAF